MARNAAHGRKSAHAGAGAVSRQPTKPTGARNARARGKTPRAPTRKRPKEPRPPLVHDEGDDDPQLAEEDVMTASGQRLSTEQRLLMRESFVNLRQAGLSAGVSATPDSIKATAANVYCWGAGYNGQLGQVPRRGVSKFSSTALPVHFAEPVAVSHISCGARFGAVVSDAGKVFTWGHDDHGQLGLGTADVQKSKGSRKDGLRAGEPIPRLVQSLAAMCRVVTIACGATHTVAVDEVGSLYTWGSGRHGELGHSSHADERIPRRVESCDDQRFVDAAAGDTHTAVRSAEGHVFTFGSGHNGALGHGSTAEETAPRILQGLVDAKVKVKSVECGPTITGAVTADGRLMLWGFGQKLFAHDPPPVEAVNRAQDSRDSAKSRGELSTESSSIVGVQQGDMRDRNTVLVPHMLQLRFLVKSFSAGKNHLVVLTEDGDVYTWGGGANGQLGHGQCSSLSMPRVVLLSADVVSVAAGRYHNLALTKLGVVFSWGCGQNGQLGHARKSTNMRDECVPRVIEHMVPCVIGQISCGEYHSCALGSRAFNVCPELEEWQVEMQVAHTMKESLVRRQGGIGNGLVARHLLRIEHDAPCLLADLHKQNALDSEQSSASPAHEELYTRENAAAEAAAAAASTLTPRKKKGAFDPGNTLAMAIAAAAAAPPVPEDGEVTEANTLSMAIKAAGAKKRREAGGRCLADAMADAMATAQQDLADNVAPEPELPQRRGVANPFSATRVERSQLPSSPVHSTISDRSTAHSVLPLRLASPLPSGGGDRPMSGLMHRAFAVGAMSQAEGRRQSPAPSTGRRRPSTARERVYSEVMASMRPVSAKAGRRSATPTVSRKHDVPSSSALRASFNSARTRGGRFELSDLQQQHITQRLARATIHSPKRLQGSSKSRDKPKSSMFRRASLVVLLSVQQQEVVSVQQKERASIKQSLGIPSDNDSDDDGDTADTADTDGTGTGANDVTTWNDSPQGKVTGWSSAEHKTNASLPPDSRPVHDNPRNSHQFAQRKGLYKQSGDTIRRTKGLIVRSALSDQKVKDRTELTVRRLRSQLDELQVRRQKLERIVVSKREEFLDQRRLATEAELKKRAAQAHKDELQSELFAMGLKIDEAHENQEAVGDVLRQLGEEVVERVGAVRALQTDAHDVERMIARSNALAASARTSREVARDGLENFALEMSSVEQSLQAQLDCMQNVRESADAVKTFRKAKRLEKVEKATRKRFKHMQVELGASTKEALSHMLKTTKVHNDTAYRQQSHDTMKQLTEMSGADPMVDMDLFLDKWESREVFQQELRESIAANSARTDLLKIERSELEHVLEAEALVATHTTWHEVETTRQAVFVLKHSAEKLSHRVTAITLFTTQMLQSLDSACERAEGMLLQAGGIGPDERRRAKRRARRVTWNEGEVPDEVVDADSVLGVLERFACVVIHMCPYETTGVKERIAQT